MHLFFSSSYLKGCKHILRVKHNTDTMHNYRNNVTIIYGVCRNYFLFRRVFSKEVRYVLNTYRIKTCVRNVDNRKGNMWLSYCPCIQRQLMLRSDIYIYIYIYIYRGPLTYKLNSFPRARRNSSWS